MDFLLQSFRQVLTFQGVTGSGRLQLCIIPLHREHESTLSHRASDSLAAEGPTSDEDGRYTYTDARTDTHPLSLSRTKRVPNLHVLPQAHTEALYACACGWRLAAGGWQMLSAGSGRRLPVKHLLDTLVTLLKRACVRDFAVVMKLSTASRTRVMDWTSVCVYDWMCLRVQRGRAGLRVTAEIHACIHGCAHVYVVCTRMYTRTRARTHTKRTTCHVTGKTLLTPAQV